MFTLTLPIRLRPVTDIPNVALTETTASQLSAPQSPAHNPSRLEMLPTELVENVCYFSEPKAIGRLAATCRTLYHKSLRNLYLPEVSSCGYGSTFYWACRSGRPGTVELLLQYGFCPTPTPRPQVSDAFLDGSPLELAVIFAAAPIVKLLLECGADPNLGMNSLDNLLSEKSASRVLGAKAATVKLLLKQGADPNRRAGDATPLYVAIMHDNLEVVRLLLKHGADPNLPGWGPEFPSYLSAHVRGRYTQYPASPLGAAISMFTSPGELPHLHSPRLGLEIVRLLLSHGADVSRRVDESYGYPCQVAVQYGVPLAMLQLILDSGADPCATDPESFDPSTALQKAMSPRIHPDYARLLLECGADPTPPGWSLDNRDSTALGSLITSHKVRGELTFPWQRGKKRTRGGPSLGRKDSGWDKFRLLVEYGGPEIVRKVPRASLAALFYLAVAEPLDSRGGVRDTISIFARVSGVPLSELRELAQSRDFYKSWGLIYSWRRERRHNKQGFDFTREIVEHLDYLAGVACQAPPRGVTRS